jgi:ABC-type lipoprotein release transport system permease subunit
VGLVVLVARGIVGRRWRSHLAVALLVGLAVGVGLTCLAGARRTQSAHGRFLRAVDASTVTVSSPGTYNEATNAALAALPEVERSSSYLGIDVYALRGGVADVHQNFEASGTFDGRYVDQDRFTPLHGRAADPARVDEVVVNEWAAERLGYRVGQRLDLAVYSLEGIQDPDFGSGAVAPSGRVEATIVGVGVLPDEVLQDDGDRVARLLLTQAFTERFRPETTYAVQGLVLRNGDADLRAVRKEVAALDPAGLAFFRPTSVDAFHADQATRPMSLALAAFGFTAAVAGLVLGGQSVARLVRAESETVAVLRALGAPRRAIAGSVLVPSVATVAVGVGLAVAVAVAASPLMPIGPLRRVEPNRGIDVDGAVLGVGAIATLVVLVVVAVVAVVAATRRARTTEPASPRRGTVEPGTFAPLGPAAAMGLRQSLGRGSTRPAAARGLVAGMGIAVTAVVGAAIFGASLDRLVATPRLFGWSSDLVAMSGQGYGNFETADMAATLDADPRVDAWSGARFGAADIDGREVQLLGMDPGAALAPPLRGGRAVLAEDEVVLGSETAAQLGVGVGDTVTYRADGAPTPLHVVGLATLPTIGIVHGPHPSLGVGAVVPTSLMPNLDRDITGAVARDLGPNVVFVRLADGTDIDGAVSSLTEGLRASAGFAGIDVLPPQRPAEIVNADALGRAPLLLAGLLALAALASQAAAITASVRQRRRELATLKVVGFTRRQLGATVAWQATATTVAGLVIGVPLGIAVGHVAWRAFASQLDVLDRPALPTTGLLALATGLLVVVNLVSAVPARTARRVTTAQALRPEPV